MQTLRCRLAFDGDVGCRDCGGELFGFMKFKVCKQLRLGVASFLASLPEKGAALSATLRL